MGLGDRLTRQLGHPRGLAGRLLLPLLDRVNAGMNRTALAALALGPDDRFLEVGFGGGDLIRRALRTAPPALVTGVDRSAVAVATARRRWRREIAAGTLAVHEADVASLPFEDATFTAACTVNTIYFWPDPERALAELRRVLAAGGRLVLAYNAVPPAGTRTYEPAEVEELCQAAGFETMRTAATRDRANGLYYCTVASVISRTRR